MGLKENKYWEQRRANWVQTLWLLGGGFFLAYGLGWLFFGGSVLVMLGVMVGLGLWMAGRSVPQLLFRVYRGVPLDRVGGNAELLDLTVWLAKRAGLSHVPRLYYLPSSTPNAFTAGVGRYAAIGISDAILRGFSRREIAGILAHEVAHIKHRDTLVLGLADAFTRFTRFLSGLGFVLIFLNLPAILLGAAVVPWSAVLLLTLALIFSGLLQLGLSRTREYDADAEAVRLTGDPRGLIQALRRLEYRGLGFFERLFVRRVPDAEPSWLRTHPAIEERILRLEELEQKSTMRTFLRWPSFGSRSVVAGRPTFEEVRKTSWFPLFS